MIIFFLSLLSNAQVEECAKCIPAIVSQLDNPEFEIRELATDVLITVGKVHIENPKNIRLHYLNHQIRLHLHSLEKVSAEKRYRINMILEQISEKKDVEHTMLDALRQMYGGSKVVLKE
jgi:hypothetical protein